MSSIFGNLNSGGNQNTSGQSGSSLFGTTGANTGSSLFGNNAASNSNANSSGGSGGLFGRVQTSTATTTAGQTSSLFGGNNATSGATGSGGGSGSSLFGGGAQTGTSGQTSGTGLFSNMGGNKSQAEQKPSLFAGLGSSTAGQQQNIGGSLFGGNTANTPNQQQGTAVSFFGPPHRQQCGGAGVGMPDKLANSLGQTNTNLFGNTLPSQANQNRPADGSILGESSFRQQMSDPNAPFVQRVPNEDEAPPQPAYFDSLLERGRKRQQDENLTPFGELPQLQLGLADISRKVRKLGQDQGPSAGLVKGSDARTHYLLSASGVSASKALRDLESLTGRRGTVSSMPMDDASSLGVKDTLAQKYQDDFKDLVDNQRRRAQEDFERMIDEKLHDVDWTAHRQRIYEHFGLSKPSNLDESNANGMNGTSFGRSSMRRGKSTRFGGSGNEKSFGISGLSKSVIGSVAPKAARQSAFADVAEKTPADGLRPAPEDRFLRMKQDKYTTCVQELNARRLQEKLYPILHKFADVEAEPSNEDTTMLVQSCNALIQIVSEQPQEASASDPGAVNPRQYARDYLDENERSPGQMAIRRRIVNGSRKFLEQLYLSQIEATVAKNPREANVGGVPTTISKVKGFVRVKASRKELGPDLDLLQLVNDNYCWAILYYLFRCGLFEDALTYIDENNIAFKQIDRHFVNYLRSYVSSPERRLSPDQQNKINNVYSSNARNAPEDTIDPYRMMCYKIVGRCDLQRRNFPDNIVGSTDHNDWLWLQFSLAREYDRVDELQQNAFDLRDVRKAIKEIGERHFGPGNDFVHAPMLFFFMQILAGQYEKAISDLYPYNYVSAVHFAIALDYYGLLRVSNIENSDELLTHTTSELPQVAFDSMIGLYTRDFRTANPTAAADYLCLICLNSDLTGDIGKRHREVCHQALTELVLETREYAQLIGDIRGDGRRIKGAIEQRLQLIGLENEQDFLKHITLVAARTAEDQSRTTDAALLFHLAEDYDRVLQVANDALSQYLTTELGEQPARMTPLKPRSVGEAPGANGQPQQNEGGSLSLTAIDDPVQLAQAMRSLYSQNAMYFNKISNKNGDACNVLLKLADARKALEQSRWANAVDSIRSSQILPTDDHGNMSAIRTKVRDFEAMPVVLARTIGHVMLWAVVGCSNQAAVLRSEAFETGERRQAIANCVDVARDIMMFAGMIKFKLPARVVDAIARAGQEVGVY